MQQWSPTCGLSLSGDDDRDSDVEAEALLLAKQKMTAKTKRRQSVHEQMLAAELGSIRDENKELKAGIQTADDKPNRKVSIPWNP
jgi:hypothetical protein